MADTSHTDGLVLAAGGSQRMGRPKALLQVGAETFIDHAMRVLREGGCRAVHVVAGNDPEVHAAVHAAGAHLLLNPDATSAQFDSVKIGMRALPADSSAVAV
ncbi:MAG: nucleotidyltransferase family protein, partial [Longimicrobiales bacterium]